MVKEPELTSIETPSGVVVILFDAGEDGFIRDTTDWAVHLIAQADPRFSFGIYYSHNEGSQEVYHHEYFFDPEGVSNG